MKSQSEKFVNVFRDFDELTKKILDEFKHSAEYIKDLENHIKEIQNIEKVEEKTVNNNEKV